MAENNIAFCVNTKYQIPGGLWKQIAPRFHPKPRKKSDYFNMDACQATASIFYLFDEIFEIVKMAWDYIWYTEARGRGKSQDIG